MKLDKKSSLNTQVAKGLITCLNMHASICGIWILAFIDQIGKSCLNQLLYVLCLAFGAHFTVLSRTEIPWLALTFGITRQSAGPYSYFV